MKIILRKYLNLLLVFISILSAQKTFSNAAQPGIWNAGGKVFTMLYPEDSLTFKKVQMQEERIYIQLYKGYAVVKGTYLFKNTTKEKLSFKMGYPVNGIYAGGGTDLNQITIDSLSHFKIKANERWINLLKENHPELSNNDGNVNPFSDNWMVWQMAFAPAETQTVEVYFIVNTNNAQVRQGYNLENRNAFIYLLESGSVWHQPIEKGYFYVQLKEDLGVEDMAGISMGFNFKFNQRHQIYAGYKNNFSPTPKDNLVVTYHEHDELFDFEKVISQSDHLFAEVDELSNLSFEALNFDKIEIASPYETEGTFWGFFPGLLMLFVISAPLIIGAISFIIVIWAIYKWTKIKKKRG